MDGQGMSYAAAGVDIDAAQSSLDTVTDAIASTYDDRVLGGIGAFGGLFQPRFGSDETILVSSIDGVGTKTKLAQMTGDYRGIGHDIVNHCANDILCQGARPLFFLDYFGCSRLEPEAFTTVVTGAADACRAIGCALIGGETAEMPGVYHDGEIDIVGCIVGAVEPHRRLPQPAIKPTDRLIGLASNGLHTNGYSLARRALFDVGGLSVRDSLDGSDETLADLLLRPHTCYVQPLLPLIDEGLLRGIAHITGGGIPDNLVRTLPSNVSATVWKDSWTPLPIFQAIQEQGHVDDAEMYRAFNMGIGMVLVVDQDSVTTVLDHLAAQEVAAAEIGELSQGTKDVTLV